MYASKGLHCLITGRQWNGKKYTDEAFLGLLHPSSGEVILKGKALQHYSIKERASHISYVPQSTHVAFAFCALDIVLMGRIAF